MKFKNSWFLKAALPGIAVLVFHELAGQVFGHEPYVDPLMHLAGGAAAAFFFLHFTSHNERRLGALTVGGQCLMALGLTSLVATGWEFAEYLSDLYLGTTTHTSIGSTLRDLLNGLLGSLGITGWRYFTGRRVDQ